MATLQAQWIKALTSYVEDWELSKLDDKEDLRDAFSKDVSFGTGGIRALMGIGPNRLNRLTVARTSAGLADYLKQSERETPLVVLAFDTRRHSKEFAETAACVLASNGCRSLLFQTCQPTPVLSFAVRTLAADAGVMITASHNAMEYNGYKVYDRTGDQATDGFAHSVQACILKRDVFAIALPRLQECLEEGSVGWVSPQIVDAYISAVFSQSSGVSCADVTTMYSPLNGTGTNCAEHILGMLNLSYGVVAEQASPDGMFPTCPQPNPELPQAMRLVSDGALAKNMDLALANDPDADRIGVSVRHNGSMRLLTGDEVGLLLFDFLCHTKPLSKHPVAVSTIVSSPLLNAIAATHDVELRRTLTGFKYIGEQINALVAQGREEDFLIGVEESCGYLVGTYNRDKDGIEALMLVCELAAWHKANGRTLVHALAELYGRYGHMLSQQVSVSYVGTKGSGQLASIMSRLRKQPPENVGGLAVEHVIDYLNGAPMPGNPTQTLPPSNVVELVLTDGSKVIIRPSGTEPKIKAYCFAYGQQSNEAQNSLNSIVADVKGLL